MLTAALEYLARGWAVFPIGAPKNGKHGTPLIRWAPYQDRLPTQAQVRQWWGQWPEANVGIITGKISKIVVVDVDPRKGGAPDGLPETQCIARTGGGGWHYFYRYPENTTGGIDNQSNADTGLDVRADGGYVIAAPSKHHSGGSYSWQSTGTPGPSAPQWALRKRSKQTSPERKEPWLAKLVRQGTRPGQRNQDLTRLAGYLASTGMPEDVALEFGKLWIRDQESPLGEDEVQTTVHSAYRTERRRNPARFAAAKKRTARKLFSTHTLNQFMVKYGDQEIRWSVEGWLPEATIGFIASPPGGFKTWLTFDLAVSVASGRPFLGKYPVSEPGPVLLVQQEDFNAQTAERNALVILNRFGMTPPDLSALDKGLLDIPVMPSDEELQLHFHAERQLRFDDPELMDALEEAVREIRPKLVICDPFYQLVTTDDHMVKAAADMSRLKTLRDQYGTSFLLVHHTTKGGENEWGRSKLWGSQFLNAFSETLWHIRRPEEEPFNVVKRSFKLSGIQEPVKINFDIDIAGYSYVTGPEVITKEEAQLLIQAPNQGPAGGKPTGAKKKILRALAASADGLTSDELEEIVGPIRGTTLRKLVDSGDIVQDAAQRWHHAVPDLG